MSMESIYRKIAFLLLLVLMPGIGLAHSAGQSYVFMQLDDETIGGWVEIGVADLNTVFDLDLSTNNELLLEQVVPLRERLEEYYLSHLAFKINEQDMPINFEQMRLFGEKTQYVVLDFKLPASSAIDQPETMEVMYSVLFNKDPKHRGLLVVDRNFQTGTFNNEAIPALIFAPKTTVQTMDLTAGSTWQGLRAMIASGVHHIWIGIDHILFLIALLLPGVLVRRDGVLKPVDSAREALIYLVKIVTIFTVAHTITLSYATLSAVELSPRIVESIIALSIAIAALDMLYPIFRGKIGWIVFAFGLFHGFGFASVLGDIGLPDKYLGMSLLGFNIGVELGQLAIVLGVFPLLFFIRKTNFYLKFLVPVGAIFLILIALYWFTERAFEIDLPAGEIIQNVLGVKF